MNVPIEPGQGVHNLRDVGPQHADGGDLPAGRLYRSDALHALSESGGDAVRRLGLELIIDLRADWERTVDPSIDGLAARTETIDLDGGELAAAAEQHGIEGIELLDVNHTLLERRGAELAQAVRLIAGAAPGPVLVHCSAGKDRTGLVIGTVLAALGVDTEAIAADYARSEEGLVGEWAETTLGRLAPLGVPDTPRVRALLAGSPAAVMIGTLRRLDELGGARAYLTANGVSAGELAALRRLLD